VAQRFEWRPGPRRPETIEAEAEAIRRIFRDFTKGESPRAIAVA